MELNSISGQPLRPRIRVDRRNPPPLKLDDLVRFAEPGGFYQFCLRVMPYSFEDGFIDGAFVEQICNFLELYRRTARVSAKDHFKSTSIKAYFLWRLFTLAHVSTENHYVSYEEGMAAYHTTKIKNWVKVNPYFNGESGRAIIDHKPTADSIIDYSWDRVHHHTMEPTGMLSFKRGIHTGPNGVVFGDDLLKDPENKLVLTKIKVVNETFESQLMDMPDPSTGELHVVGTPQTDQDFFFNTNLMRRFAVIILPAIVNEAKREALWPEYMPFEELVARRAERPQLFEQEYLCKPGYAKDSYITEAKLDACTSATLEPRNIFGTIDLTDPAFQTEVIAAIDIGKKAHPSHFVVWAKVPLYENGVWTGKYRKEQLLETWMDHWDYTKGDRDGEFNIEVPTQIEYVKHAKRRLRIDRIYYDATRGEWEGFVEQGVIDPGTWIPVVFGLKTKTEMAETFDKEVTAGTVTFLPGQRQRSQILAVLKDLKAIESPSGHGDAFWSNAMALKGLQDGQETRVHDSKPAGW